MAALRCTRKLLDRLGAGAAAPAGGAAVGVEPTTVLGDWYATVFVAARRPLVLAAAERSLCPVVLPLTEARTGSTLVPRWREAVGHKLAALGVAPAQVAAELAALADAGVAPASYRGPHAAAGRRMVGVLTDMLYHCAPHVVRLHAGPGLRVERAHAARRRARPLRHGRSARPAAVRAAPVRQPGRNHASAVRGSPDPFVN